MEYQILGFPGGRAVKTPPASAGDGSPGGKNATHSSIPAWKIP